jgi:hypothetical protein
VHFEGLNVVPAKSSDTERNVWSASKCRLRSWCSLGLFRIVSIYARWQILILPTSPFSISIPSNLLPAPRSHILYFVCSRRLILCPFPSVPSFAISKHPHTVSGVLWAGGIGLGPRPIVGIVWTVDIR